MVAHRFGCNKQYKPGICKCHINSYLNNYLSVTHDFEGFSIQETLVEMNKEVASLKQAHLFLEGKKITRFTTSFFALSVLFLNYRTYLLDL